MLDSTTAVKDNTARIKNGHQKWPGPATAKGQNSKGRPTLKKRMAGTSLLRMPSGQDLLIVIMMVTTRLTATFQITHGVEQTA
jgi:hypothetical protein